MRMRSNADAVEFDYNVINRLRWLECGYGQIEFYLKRLKAIDRITLNADVCGWIQRIWLNTDLLKGFVVVAVVC